MLRSRQGSTGPRNRSYPSSADPSLTITYGVGGASCRGEARRGFIVSACNDEGMGCLDIRTHRRAVVEHWDREIWSGRPVRTKYPG